MLHTSCYDHQYNGRAHPPTRRRGIHSPLFVEATRRQPRPSLPSIAVLDLDSDDLAPTSTESETLTLQNAAILKSDLYGMLQELDVDASEEESMALFKYLDADDSGEVTLEEVSERAVEN